MESFVKVLQTSICDFDAAFRMSTIFFLRKITYCEKLRLRDFKELSLLRASQRLYKLISVTSLYHFASQFIHLLKVTYVPKSKLMEWRELSVLRSFQKSSIPFSESRRQLLTNRQTYLTKITYDRKLREMDSKELSVFRLLPRFFKP